VGGAAPRERIVLVDANGLFTAARLRLDITKRLQEAAPGWTAVVPESVVRELEVVGRRKFAREARALAERLPLLANDGRGDAAIMAAALSGPKRAVLTNDGELRTALREKGIPVLFVRGSATIEVDGAL
jgi:rRNA-processing protein FCF1